MKSILQYKSALKSVALGAIMSLLAINAQAQLVDGTAFLRGKYIEVCLAPNAQFGSTTPAPDGYHPRGGDIGGYGTGTFGFVSDPALDGWEVGTPDFVGCYFLPGVPQEGWDMSIGGDWYRAWASDVPFGESFWGGSWSGSVTGFGYEGSRVYATWEGNIGDLNIRKKVSFDTNQVFFLIEVQLKNVGTTAIPDIVYSRTLDPDNESSMGGGSTTTNVIENQPNFATGNYRCLVSATGQSWPDLTYLGLGTVDCRATAYILSSGLYPSEAPPVGLKDEPEEHPGWNIDSGYTYVNDIGVGIIFDLGTMLPGDSTNFTYSYVLSSADLDTAMNSIQTSFNIDETDFQSGDTMIKCWGAEVDMKINGGGAYVWGEWEDMNGGPSLPAGRENTIHIEHSVLTYRIIGTTTICPVSDTLFMTFIPEGDSVIINHSMCAGEVYDFMGDLKYQTGVYVNARKTSIGCDSIVLLNLTVNPLPEIDLTARETEICEGEEALLGLTTPSSFANYQWYKNGAVIPGATQHTYAADEPGVYYVAGISDKGCDATSRNITVVVNPAASGAIVSISEQDVCIGDTVTLKSDAKANYQYSWSPEAFFRYTGGSLSPTATAVVPGTSEVYLMSMNEYGCKDFDTAVVQAHPCCDIYIPTAFTPNNDGLNDNFLPALRPGQVVVALQVFARNGQMVYDNNEPLKGWNGLMNNSGELLPQAVYMYRFIYTCTDGEVYETKGDLTLMR